MTNQEVFDIIVSHLRQQNRKSQQDGICLYRGPNSRKCAVGCLITDEEFDKIKCSGLNGDDWETVIDNNSFLKEKFNENYDLIIKMQNIHDNHYVVEWEDQFKRVALLFNLLVPS